jgi:hypothetical protein
LVDAEQGARGFQLSCGYDVSSIISSIHTSIRVGKYYCRNGMRMVDARLPTMLIERVLRHELSSGSSETARRSSTMAGRRGQELPDAVLALVRPYLA